MFHKRGWKLHPIWGHSPESVLPGNKDKNKAFGRLAQETAWVLVTKPQKDSDQNSEQMWQACALTEKFFSDLRRG